MVMEAVDLIDKAVEEEADLIASMIVVEIREVDSEVDPEEVSEDNQEDIEAAAEEVVVLEAIINNERV